MAAKLRVTQTKSTISHIARNRATIRALGLQRIGDTVEVRRTTTRPAAWSARSASSSPSRRCRRAPTTPRRSPMKLHDLRPAPRGRHQAQDPGRPRHRRRQGQDRGPRHQGPEGPGRRLDPALVRGRPDAAPHPDPEAARLHATVQDRLRGRERRRDRRGGRARRVRVGRAARRAEGQEGRADHRQPGHAPRRRARPHADASRSRSSATASRRVPLFVVADAFTKSAPREDRGRRRDRPGPRDADQADRGARRRWRGPHRARARTAAGRHAAAQKVDARAARVEARPSVPSRLKLRHGQGGKPSKAQEGIRRAAEPRRRRSDRRRRGPGRRGRDGR